LRDSPEISYAGGTGVEQGRGKVEQGEEVTMAFVSLVTHKVKDFAAWKKVYDSVKGVQKEGGVRAHSVLQASDDPNLVTVTHTVDTLAAAQAFFTSNPALKKAMIDAGVDVANMKLAYYEEVASGKL
jgi:hypothetical protein